MVTHLHRSLSRLVVLSLAACQPTDPTRPAPSSLGTPSPAATSPAAPVVMAVTAVGPSATAGHSPAPTAGRPNTGATSCSDFSYRFPSDELAAAAGPCTTAADCIAVPFGGSCQPVTSGTLTSPLAATYRAWAGLGCNAPSGSPASLVPAPTARFSEVCGLDWAGVRCDAGRCALASSDCEYAGMRAVACVAKGGQWGGCIEGRGRSPGCSLPTRDAGKACTDSAQCESACVHGTCYRFTHYKGCGVLRAGQATCVD